MGKRTIKSSEPDFIAQTEQINDAVLNQDSSAANTIKLDRVPHHLNRHFSSVREAIGAIAQELVLTRGYLTNKDILLQLIVMLELTESVSQHEILRTALKLVAAGTPEDA